MWLPHSQLFDNAAAVCNPKKIGRSTCPQAGLCCAHRRHRASPIGGDALDCSGPAESIASGSPAASRIQGSTTGAGELRYGLAAIDSSVASACACCHGGPVDPCSHCMRGAISVHAIRAQRVIDEGSHTIVASTSSHPSQPSQPPQHYLKPTSPIKLQSTSRNPLSSHSHKHKPDTHTHTLSFASERSTPLALPPQRSICIVPPRSLPRFAPPPKQFIDSIALSSQFTSALPPTRSSYHCRHPPPCHRGSAQLGVSGLGPSRAPLPGSHRALHP